LVTFAKAEIPGLEERFAEVRGCRVRYLVGGEGEPLVLVHGLGGAASNWFALAPLLLGGRRLLVPELPGHGGSSPLAAAPALSTYADRVASLMEREGISPAPVVGHSLGGAVALRLAIRRPELVSGLVLAGAAGISSGTRTARYALTVTGTLKPGKRIAPHRARVARSVALKQLVFGRWGAADPPALPVEVAESFLEGPERHTDTISAARALMREDPRADLDRVRCPALVLWGARDNQLPIADGFEYARRLHAPLRVIADCGHLLIGERPELCADAIERFLAKEPAA
jgi:2-hydroxy-6-oxonona-2,4-dienedioate hydrolase/4,5:9,10-diseco-3-hydroxy-5,9,17-trioxoandrosta-1(10),2-diene-4-oate hydrolase